MASLIRFEDTYGLADIFKATHNIEEDFTDLTLYKLTDNLYIEIGTGIPECHTPNRDSIAEYKAHNIDRIISVFDMDDIKSSNKRILSKEDMQKQLTKSKRYMTDLKYDIKWEFIPVVYSAETIMLYQFITDANPETDIENLVHPYNVNAFYLDLLARVLCYKNPKRAKHVHKYLNLDKLKSKIRMSLVARPVNINKKLLEWILEDCPVDKQFMIEEELLQFLDEVLELFNKAKQHSIDFKVGTEQMCSHIHLRDLERSIERVTI